jgi:putative DNA primase/helicase
MMLDPLAVARALGGEGRGRRIAAPGPGHSRADRSLSIVVDPSAPDGYVVHSHAGDDWRACRDHVAAALGIAGRCTRPTSPRTSRGISHRPTHDHDEADRVAAALRIWHASRDPRGTVAEDYLISRGLILEDVAGDVIRYDPPAGAMVTLCRDIRTDHPCGLHRTFLDAAGRKVGRKMLGRVRHAAIKLDRDDDVTLGLHAGEGVETAIAARLAGFRPVWALGSAGAITAFPVLPGIEVITILGETGDGGANHRAAQACTARWIEAGREALIVMPLVGDDLADVWREAVP